MREKQRAPGDPDNRSLRDAPHPVLSHHSLVHASLSLFAAHQAKTNAVKQIIAHG